MEKLDFEDFHRRFATEEDCVRALFAARWPNGFCCPRCNFGQACTIKSRRLPLYECADCGHQTSIIAGTIMKGSRTPLLKWFQAIHLHALPAGISATLLSATIGVTYKTAWLMGQKIRHAFSGADKNELLRGLVRLTPSLYGRLCYSSSYREVHEHPLLVGASLNDKAEINQIKIKQVAESDVVGKTVSNCGKRNFVLSHVQPDVSEVASDTPRHNQGGASALSQIGKAVGNWLNETFNGIGPKHLQSYLDQFSYQFNQRLRKVSVFDASLTWCAVTVAITYSELVSRPSRIPAKYVPNWSPKQLALKKTG